MKPLLISVAVCTILGTISGQKFNRQYVGVAYSPYTDRFDDPQSSPRSWNAYTESDITAQLTVVRSYFSSISTYSMGTADYNRGKPWDQCASNALIARVAAKMNQQSSTKLNVNIGIYQDEDRARAIGNAFSAADEANRLSRNTVWGITITNEYITTEPRGHEVLNMIKNNKDNARRRGLKIGTRIHVCGEFLGGNLRNVLGLIAKESDFIYCNVYPSNQHAQEGPRSAAINVMYYFLELQKAIKRVNPNIEVIIGETGWPSEGNSFNNSPNSVQNEVIYWKEINSLAVRKRVKVQMFEAIDEPWKGRSSQNKAESHYGWWSKPRSRENRFIEKETGRAF
ncbi:unnamed protein product [Allacma fusca]|uniref:glucan endo-1,3-beta-D-glucosidase n=1 Tax=Allacma fusca TaxID=39272 RepID=A0A8J2JF31_9HEXA|nr:unnamed protein product [Allacma fusca]